MLVPDNGSYDMQVTEEYDEISYLDRVELYTVDHSPDVDILPGLMQSDFNTFYTVSKTPGSLVSCMTDNGTDCSQEVSAKDGNYTSEPGNLTIDWATFPEHQRSSSYCPWPRSAILRAGPGPSR